MTKRLPALSMKEFLRLFLASIAIAFFCYLFNVSDREEILPVINLGGFLFQLLCVIFGICYSVRQNKNNGCGENCTFGRIVFILAILWFIIILLWTNEVEPWRLSNHAFRHAWNDKMHKMTIGLFLEGFIHIRILDYSYFCGLLLCLFSYVETKWIIKRKKERNKK